MNSPSKQETAQDFEALYLAYKAKYIAMKHEAEHYRQMYLNCLAIIESRKDN